MGFFDFLNVDWVNKSFERSEILRGDIQKIEAQSRADITKIEAKIRAEARLAEIELRSYLSQSQKNQDAWRKASYSYKSQHIPGDGVVDYPDNDGNDGIGSWP